jgi:site-specific DNA recombinase
MLNRLSPKEMKKAILYVRVSTDEQAATGFSIRHQKEQLLNYCKQKDIEVLEMFTEDYSAKTFNRPEYKKLFEYAKKNKKEVDFLLFTKWDRFSRNAFESYGEMAKFKKLEISPIALEQPIDTENPEELLMQAIFFAAPEVENRRRSLNVKVGMRRSRKEGRYLGATPKGYKSIRDEFDKPFLEPNEEAKYIKQAFELMSTGKTSQRDVMRALQKQGVKITRNTLSQILKNPIYKGYVYVPGYREEPEEVVKGIHEPIVSELLFEQSRAVIEGKKRDVVPYKTKSLVKFPLRGLIECEKCGNNLTASSSKGNSGVYEYYHCSNGCSKCFSSESINNEIGTILKGLNLKSGVKELYIQMLEKDLLGDVRKNVEEKKRLKNRISILEEKLDRIQNLLIDGVLDGEDYREMKSKLKLEKLTCEESLSKVKDTTGKDFVKQLETGFGLVENLSKYYDRGTVKVKREIIGSMFPKKFIFEKSEVRTNHIDETFLLLCRNSKGLKRIKEKDVSDKSKTSCKVIALGLEPRTVCLEGRCSIQLSYATIPYDGGAKIGLFRDYPTK